MLKRIIMAFYFVSALVLPIYAVIGVQVNPNSWYVGEGGQGEWVSPDFTATNAGNETAKLSIRATNSQNWTLGAGSGNNMFSIMYSHDNVSWNPLSISNTQILDNMDGNAAYTFKLKYLSPGTISPQDVPIQYSTVTLSVTPIQIGVWENGYINDFGGKNYDDISSDVAFDSRNRPNIVCIDGTIIKLARWTGVEWIVEEITGSSVPQVVADEAFYRAISMTMDQNNNPHILFLNSSRQICYATRVSEASPWTVQVIDNRTSYMRKMQIAIDAQNRPCAAYSASGILHFARIANGVWVVTDIGAGSDTCSVDLVFDAAGNPHICATNGNVNYYYWDGSEWKSDIIDTIGVEMCTMALDSAQNPYFLYTTYTPNLYLAKKMGSTIQKYIVDNTIYDWRYLCSIKIDSSDFVYALYSTQYSTKFAKYDGTAWSYQTFNFGNVNSTVLKLDMKEHPFILRSSAFYRWWR